MKLLKRIQNKIQKVLEKKSQDSIPKNHVFCPFCKEASKYSDNKAKMEEYKNKGIPVDGWDGIRISMRPEKDGPEPGGLEFLSKSEIQHVTYDGVRTGVKYTWKCHTCGSIFGREIFDSV